MALIEVPQETKDTIKELRNEEYNGLPVDNEDEVFNLLAESNFYCEQCEEHADMYDVDINDDGIYCQLCETELKIDDENWLTG